MRVEGQEDQGRDHRPTHGLDAQELHDGVQDTAGVASKGIPAPAEGVSRGSYGPGTVPAARVL
jgi:hypothetical protein